MTASDKVLCTVRGGAWNSYVRNIRGAVRAGYMPSIRESCLGFRVIALVAAKKKN